MPKVQINHPEPVTTRWGSVDENGVHEEGSETRVDPTVWVCWDRGTIEDDGRVQLTVSCAFSYVKDLVAAEWNKDVLASSPGLTRSELNKMIATLRRARDAAFGRDE